MDDKSREKLVFDFDSFGIYSATTNENTEPPHIIMIRIKCIFIDIAKCNDCLLTFAIVHWLRNCYHFHVKSKSTRVENEQSEETSFQIEIEGKRPSRR